MLRQVCVLAALVAIAQSSPAIHVKNGVLEFQASDFKFRDMDSKWPSLIEATKAKIQAAVANNEDAQPLLDLLKKYNTEMAAEPDTSLTLRALEASVSANAASVSGLKTSVDTLVTDTIAELKQEQKNSESRQLIARNALDKKLVANIVAVQQSVNKNSAAASQESGRLSTAIAKAQGEIDAAAACGKAGKLFTSGGCKEIEIPDTNLQQYTAKGCDGANTGALEYTSINGQMCLMLCSKSAWMAVNEGKYGQQCNPAKTCADVAGKKLPSGVYQFITKTTNGLPTETRVGHCDVTTKLMSYDGHSAANFARSCSLLFTSFPFADSGKYWIGKDAKSAKITDCKKASSEQSTEPDRRVPTNSMITWWDAADYSGGSTWKARGGGMGNPGFSSSKPERATGGEGAHSGYKSIKGHTNSHRIQWGNIVRGSWTLCTTAKYDGSSRGRIFTGSGNNWLHGHWGGNSGSSYYQGWKVNGALNSKRTQWIAWCATNGQGRSVWGNNVGMNGAQRHAGGVSTRTNSVHTGPTGTHGGESSHYRIGSVMSWSRSFSEAEMKSMIEYLIDRLKGKAN